MEGLLPPCTDTANVQRPGPGGHGWFECLAGIGQRAVLLSMPFKKVTNVSGNRSLTAAALTGAVFHNTRVLKEVSIWWIAEISWQPRPRLPWGARKPLHNWR